MSKSSESTHFRSLRRVVALFDSARAPDGFRSRRHVPPIYFLTIPNIKRQPYHTKPIQSISIQIITGLSRPYLNNSWSEPIYLLFRCMPPFPTKAAFSRPSPAHPNPDPLVLAVVVFAYPRDAQPLLPPRCTYYALRCDDAAPLLGKQEKRKKRRKEKERYHNPTTETKNKTNIT